MLADAGRSLQCPTGMLRRHIVEVRQLMQEIAFVTLNEDASIGRAIDNAWNGCARTSVMRTSKKH